MAARAVGVDDAASDQWVQKSATRFITAIDGPLAAIALANGLTLVTFNDRDVAGLGATVPTHPVKGRQQPPSLYGDTPRT
jgi:predicted nucleic acid-binding protein